MKSTARGGFGGGKVFTATLARALRRLGTDTLLFADPHARSWSSLPMPDTRVEPLADPADLPGLLRGKPRSWLLFHTLASADVVEELRSQGHLVSAFAHMPLYGRDPRPLAPFDVILAGSRHVIASLRAAGIRRVHPEPLYAVAQMNRVGAGSELLRARSRYDWDRRKLRDRTLGALEPLWRRFLSEKAYARRSGLALGVVSRITPIKQFPLLFTHLAPILARYPAVHLEIFGSGGFSSVPGLSSAPPPVPGRGRFWGHQQDVGAVYRAIDFLLTGLPEKEALGLNVIEAQARRPPVIAPGAAHVCAPVTDEAPVPSPAKPLQDRRAGL